MYLFYFRRKSSYKIKFKQKKKWVKVSVLELIYKSLVSIVNFISEENHHRLLIKKRFQNDIYFFHLKFDCASQFFNFSWNTITV